MMIRRLLTFALLCWMMPVAADAPRVVASILPVHSLVSGVMEGIAEPRLLIGANASPHDYAMKPSDARALAEAQFVVWVGEGLETMLERPLRSLASGAQVLTLSELEGMNLLPVREGRDWGEHDHEDDGHAHNNMDTHLWLSPHNARSIVKGVAERLGEMDPANALRYQANAAALTARITTLEAKLQQQLASVQKLPYLVFHDAYHYYEDTFGLHPVGAIAVSPERRPGARHLIEIRQVLRDSGARCVFSEPQFLPAIVEVVLEGSDARHGVLDPLGASIRPGKEQWFALMQRLADSLTGCLAGEP